MRKERRHASGESTAADRHQDEVRFLIEYLECDTSLACDDFGIIEGVEEARVGGFGEVRRIETGLIEVSAMKDDLRTELAGALDLGQRRAVGNDSGGTKTGMPCCPGHTGRMIPSGGRDHGAIIAALALSEQGVEGSAHLVGARFLQIFKFEQTDPARCLPYRSPGENAVNSVRSIENILGRDNIVHHATVNQERCASNLPWTNS